MAYTESRYPQYLAAGVSASERRANMEFLRDRMIEAGICGGMDLGWNLKRGGPELSTDYLVHRSGGQDLGVDIGYAYDDTSQPLRLAWQVNAVGPGQLVFYLSYDPRPSCR